MYDRVCEARVLVRGIEHGETIARSPNQPLTLSEALEVYANLSREFVAGPREVSLTALDSLQDFFALMLQYPVIPRLAADTKECPECYFETVGRDQKDALVLPLRHESFALVEGSSAGVVDPSEERNLGALADGGEEMARADPCGDMFPTTKRLEDLGDRGPARAAKFLEQLEWLKRRDEIVKQNALGKEISHQLGSYSHPLEELEAPRYLSSYPLRWLYRIYGSLNRSRDRARILATSYSEERADASRARLAVEELKASLGSMASTGNQRQAALHLVASGLSVETASCILKSVLLARRGSMIVLPLTEGVELQLKRTTRPTAYNRKIAALIWLFAHITAYCTLRELPHGYVLMGDSPQDLDRDGIYVFDQDRAGFRLSSRCRGGGGGGGGEGTEDSDNQ
ncbi:hypothetical protein F2P81_018426 [Scophthalmus maximus]|nr:hypothetical protein F2P81_018426 [Scophthalmus maximus]